MAAHDNTDYRRQAPPGMVASAIEKGTLRLEVGKPREAPRLVGECPVCHGEVNTVLQKTVVEAFAPRSSKHPSSRLVNCQCGYSHPTAPAGAQGCGLQMSITITP